MEIISLGLVIFVGCFLTEVNEVTRDVANHNFGDNCRDPCYILVNMSYILPKFDSGYGR